VCTSEISERRFSFRAFGLTGSETFGLIQATEQMLGKVFTPTMVDDIEFRLIMYSLYPMYISDGQLVDFDLLLERARSGIYTRARTQRPLRRPQP